jgi:hypothetical protein
MRLRPLARSVLYSILMLLFQCPGVSQGAGSSPGYRIQHDFFGSAGGASASSGYKLSAALGNLAGTVAAQSMNYSMMTGALLPHQTSSLQALQVGIAGTGGGSVNSNPAGIACTGGVHSASFAQWSLVTLMQLPDSDSVFSGWSGACTNAVGDCIVAMDGQRSVTANFMASPLVRLAGSTTTGYSLLQDAYNAAQSGNTIQGRAVVVNGDLVADKAKTVIISGGYDVGFVSRSGAYVLDGKMLVRSGKVIASSVKIR